MRLVFVSPVAYCFIMGESKLAQMAKEATRQQMARLSPMERVERALQWGRELQTLNKKLRPERREPDGSKPSTRNRGD